MFPRRSFSIKPPKLDGWAKRRAKDKGILKKVNTSEETLTKIQLRIMDISQPIIGFHPQVKILLESRDPYTAGSIIDDLERGLDAAVQQWVRGFVYVTKLRREAVLEVMDPKFRYLLTEKKALPSEKEARKKLFFYMLKEARNDETKSDKVAVAVAPGRFYRGHGYRLAVLIPPYGYHSGLHLRFHPYEEVPEFTLQPRGGRTRRDRGGSSNNRRYSPVEKHGESWSPVRSKVNSVSAKAGASLLGFL